MSFLLFNPKKDHDIKVQSRLVIKDKKKELFVFKKVFAIDDIYRLNLNNYEPYWNFRYKFQIRGLDKKTGKERWIDATSYKILYPEKINKDGLKYLQFNNSNSKVLIVIFQAIHREPTYNYVGALSKYNVNKLFIKDGYGGDKATKSSYYIGKNKNTHISEATQKLIIKTVDELNITNTIFIGSSKGGFGALYHGFKYGASHIIAGGSYSSPWPTLDQNRIKKHCTRSNI